jgi:hypothetical protein
MLTKVRAKQKCPLQMGGWSASRRGTELVGPETSSTDWGLKTRGWSVLETGLYVINSSHVSVQWGLDLAWSDWGCHFSQAMWTSGQQDPAVCHKSFSWGQWSRMWFLTNTQALVLSQWDFQLPVSVSLTGYTLHSRPSFTRGLAEDTGRTPGATAGKVLWFGFSVCISKKDLWATIRMPGHSAHSSLSALWGDQAGWSACLTQSGCCRETGMEVPSCLYSCALFFSEILGLESLLRYEHGVELKQLLLWNFIYSCPWIS